MAGGFGEGCQLSEAELMKVAGPANLSLSITHGSSNATASHGS